MKIIKDHLHTVIKKSTKNRIEEIGGRGKHCISRGIEALVENYDKKTLTLNIITEVKL